MLVFCGVYGILVWFGTVDLVHGVKRYGTRPLGARQAVGCQPTRR